jgi:hypothetical protein
VREREAREQLVEPHNGGPAGEAVPTPRDLASLDRSLHQLARVIVMHPMAAQAAYRALVREGRAFGETEDGRRMRGQLARSELVARLRTAWELVTLGMLGDDTPPGAIPSVMIEAMVQAVLRDRFEARLADAMMGRATEEGDADGGTDREVEVEEP